MDDRRRRLLALGAMALPGLLAGVHLGGLLFFLNPELPFEPAPVVRACLLYGAVGAAVTWVPLAPLAWLRPGRALRLLPWAVILAFGAAALLDSLQAAHYAYYLPSGINDRLLKKALWLSGAGLILFYTALLHTLHRRRYGTRSRLAFWLLSLASVYLMVEQRTAYEPRPEAARPTSVESAARPSLLVVGIDSATLDAVLPLAEQGRLPFFASLLRQGAYGRLSAFAPERPPSLWTTVATGKYPFEHGVLGDRVRPAPFIAEGAEHRLLPWGLRFPRWGTFGGPGVPERGGDVRTARALWEVLPALGAPSGTVGWPALAPEPGPGNGGGGEGGVGSGFAFDDDFFGDTLDPARARPERLAERAWIFRVEAADLEPTDPTEPRALPEEVLEHLAGDVWRQGLARFLVEQGEARALFLRLPGLEEASRRWFGGHVERRLEGRTGPAIDAAAARLDAYYSRVDALVGELWAEIEGPRLLVVVSPSGAAAPEGIERTWRSLRGESLVEGVFHGAPDGMLLVAGDGVRAGTLVTGAELVDLAPTILYAVGAPVPRDLDGRVLTEVFTPEFLERQALTFVPSYEGVR
jgi:hypothetical protein